MRDGKLAVNPTGEEVRDVLKEVWEAIKESNVWPAGQEPIWSLDTCNVHKAALKDWWTPTHQVPAWRKHLGLEGDVKMPPPYSPDLHQVVEHAIANMTNHFNRRVQQALINQAAGKPAEELPNDMAGFKKWVDAAFHEGNQGCSIAKNCEKLGLKTYQAVIDRAGGFPPSRLR